MKLLWTAEGWADYLYWQSTDPAVLKRINAIITETQRHPFKGIGKPEPLRNELSGWWSRRITQEHRLVYRATGQGAAQALEVIKCRFHYHP